MTFDEYYHTYCDDSLCYEAARHAWDAAIEAACTKLVRGTNLYNISGDHISCQIIESIEQLKTY